MKKKHFLLLAGQRPAACFRLTCGLLALLLAPLLLKLPAAAAEAGIRLPQLFQTGMVLQRSQPVPVWGWAEPGGQITVQLDKRRFAASADSTGRWQVTLPPQKAGGPHTLTISSGSDTADAVSLTGVLFGDVWLLSGQSNIDVTVERVYPQYPDEIDDYENSQVRLFRVQNDVDTRTPRSDIKPSPVSWLPVTKQNAWQFSAVGYFLGKRMFSKTGVPQGIIVNSWGGTPIEAWLPADSLRRDFPLLLQKTALYQDEAYVEAQRQANQLADRRWYQVLNATDPGVLHDWTSADYDDSAWSVVSQHDWGWQGVGTVWLRQHVTIDRQHAGQPARLLLGTLFDCDYTYINGKEVGRTYYQYPPRRYDIPAGLLREGDNVLTVRFVNKYGTVHFIEPKPYLLAFGEDRQSQNPMPADVVPLSADWRMHLGVDMPPCPSGDVALQNLSTTLYNAVVHPLAPFGLAGVVWYQGESNTDNPAPYATLLRRLVTGWRQLWQRPGLPFTVVQLANYMQPSDQPQQSQWAELREAQRRVADELPAVELATAIDLGEGADIHPLRKKEVAERIGRCFDRTALGDKRVLLSPKITGFTVKEAGDADHVQAASNTAGTPDAQALTTVILTLDQPLRPDTLAEFELAGADGQFHQAAATASGCTISLSSPGVSHPVRVRHAWKDNPARLNAYAETGLPLPPFELDLEGR